MTIPQLECKLKRDDNKESKCFPSSELGSSSNSNCSSADVDQTDPFGMVLSSSKDGADEAKKDVDDSDMKMDIDSDDDNEVDEEETKLDKDDNSQPIKSNKAEEKVGHVSVIQCFLSRLTFRSDF